MSYTGSCHCGAVSFTVDADLPDKALSCNCSHCRRKGFILTPVPADNLTVDQGQDATTAYHFNSGRIDHAFCATCGCQPFSSGKGPDGQATYMVNLRCVPDADLNAMTIEQYDGKAH